jgi:hypothetical protein
LANAIRTKLWNLAYRFDGKQRKLAIGPFPRASLKDARTRREEAKRQLDLDPSDQKRLAKIAAATQQDNTFDLIADELLVQKWREVNRIGLGEACPPMTSTHTPRTRLPEGSGADYSPRRQGRLSDYVATFSVSTG